MEQLPAAEVLYRYGEPGMMLYARTLIGDQQNWKTAFYIRE